MQQFAISNALSAGAPVTCATCRLFHEGNGFCGKTDCGGPSAGRDFPSYEGPIPRTRFVERCLVCGSGEIKYQIAGLPTKFSLCKKHRGVFDHIQPDTVLKHPVTIIALP